MSTYKVERREQVVSEIQRMFGTDALVKLSELAPIPITSTGFPTLDETIGLGGIPRSCITSIWGVGTSGMLPLAYRLITSAQLNGEVVVFNDFPNTFDDQYAKNYGIDFERILLVHPNDWQHAFELTRDIIALPCTGLMVFDAGIGDPPIQKLFFSLAEALEPLNAVIRKSRWTLVFLLPLEGNSFPDHAVVLRLITKHVGLLREDGEVCGYRVQITVAKNKFRPAGQSTFIDIFVD